LGLSFSKSQASVVQPAKAHLCVNVTLQAVDE